VSTVQSGFRCRLTRLQGFALWWKIRFICQGECELKFGVKCAEPQET